MALPSFIATGSLYEILGKVASSELVQDAASRAVISLTSNHNTDFPLIWEGTINWLKQPVMAMVNVSGEIVNEEGEPLRLLARHEDLIPNLQWRISIELPQKALPPTPGGRLRSWTFDAGEDGETVPLDTAAPIASVRGIATIRGAAVDDVQLIGHELAFFVLGNEVSRVDVATLDFPASTTIVTDPETGNVTSVTEDGVTTTYAYNDDGSVDTDTRLGVTRQYSYDADGNLTTIEEV